jgi:phenylacetic acid degradation operon negative regulatory protein
VRTFAGSLQDRSGAIIRRFRQRPDSSARTLLITVFGDSIVPHGGEVWIGTLLRLVEPLGIDERLARTSLHRLVGEGLLVTRRHGRRAFYSVSPAAGHDFRSAERRIYYPRDERWDGRWTLVIETNALTPPVRSALRQHLVWLGFGSIGSAVHICPLDRTEELKPLLSDLGVCGQVAVFRGEVSTPLSLTDQDLVRATPGDLNEVETAWRAFVRRFRPLAEASRSGGRDVDRETAFLARTLLVHAYRRIVLREPELPVGLWPAAWAGDAAYEIAAGCYHALNADAEAHLTSTSEALDAPLPPFDPDYGHRYSPPRLAPM